MNSDQTLALTRALNRFSQANSLDELCLFVVEEVVGSLGFDRCGVFLYDDDRDCKLGMWGITPDGDVIDERGTQAPVYPRERLGDDEASYIQLFDQTMLYHQQTELKTGALVQCQIVESGQLLGWLFIDNLFRERSFSDDDLDFVRLFGTTIAQLIIRRRHQDMLETKNGELEKAMAELKRTQNSLYQAEKMASLSNLVIGMAHELNTPIGTAKLSASLIDHQIGDVLKSESDLSPACLSLLQDIRESSSLCLSNLNKSAALISKFKTLSDSSCVATLETRSVQSLIDETLNLIKHHHSNRELKVHLTGDALTNQMTLDSNAFHRALDEFLRNVFVHAYPNVDQPVEIWLAAEKETGCINFTITDAGEGMSMEQRHRMFEPFFTRNRQLGVGVGSTIAYNAIVQKLKGTVSVTNSSRGGVCIRFSIPSRETAGSFDL